MSRGLGHAGTAEAARGAAGTWVVEVVAAARDLRCRVLVLRRMVEHGAPLEHPGDRELLCSATRSQGSSRRAWRGLCLGWSRWSLLLHMASDCCWCC